MKLLIASPGAPSPSVHEQLLAAGFHRVYVEPRTFGTEKVTYARGEDFFASVSFADFAQHAWVLQGPEEESLAREWGTALEAEPAENIALATPSTDPRERLRQVQVLCVMSKLVRPAPSDVVAALARAVEDEEAVIRWATLGAAPLDPVFEEAVARSAERHPEMVHTLTRLRAAMEARREGTLGDTPTDDPYELERRAREGAEAGQWKRVLAAASAWQEIHEWSTEAAFYRGCAHAELGHVVPGLLFLGAAVGADEDEDTSGWVGYGDLQKRIAELRATPLAPDADLGEVADLVETWLVRWDVSSKHGMRKGSVEALAGLLPELEPTFLAIRAAWEEEGRVPLLEQALALLPSSVSLAFDLVIAREDDDRVTGDLEALLARIRAGDPEPSERFVRIRNGGFTDPVTEASVLQTLARRAYEAKRYDEAHRWADAAVAADPEDASSWQIRANALIFGGRDEEALLACRQAAENVERLEADPDMVMLGKSPSGPVRFNLACVAAKLGHREEALENLRLAIAAEENYGQEALGDDYFAALHDDPELLAICQLDPKALRTKADRDPAQIRAQMYRARDLLAQNRPTDGLALAEHVVQLAAWAEDPEVEAEALTVLMRALLFNGRADEAKAAVARALELSEDPRVPKATVALVHAQAALGHQLAGDLAAAERSYESALALRREAFGPTHPILAKTIGSLVLLAIEHGVKPAVWLPRVEEGVALAEAFLASNPPLDHVWAEAIDDLASLLVRRVVARLEEKDAAGGASDLEQAIGRMELQQRVGLTPMATHLESFDVLARELLKVADPETSVRLAQLRDRIGALLNPGTPAQASLRAAFRELRTTLTGLRMEGATDAELAADLATLVKGGPVAERLSRSPSALGLRAEIARLSTSAPTLLVTTAMALSIAEVPGKLDEALTQLEELMVGHAEG